MSLGKENCKVDLLSRIVTCYVISYVIKIRLHSHFSYREKRLSHAIEVSFVHFLTILCRVFHRILNFFYSRRLFKLKYWNISSRAEVLSWHDLKQNVEVTRLASGEISTDFIKNNLSFIKRNHYLLLEWTLYRAEVLGCLDLKQNVRRRALRRLQFWFLIHRYWLHAKKAEWKILVHTWGKNRPK